MNHTIAFELENRTYVEGEAFDYIIRIKPTDGDELVIYKSLLLFNNSDRSKIFKGALKSNKLFRAIIQIAEKLKLPSWCGETL